MGEGLDVLHQRGPPVRALLERPRRHEGRLRRPPVQLADHGGLLARHVPSRDAQDLHRHPVLPGPLALVDRRGELEGQLVLALVQAQVTAGRADGLGGQRDPVQHQVRGPGQQQPVLAAGWLGLGAVGDHDGAAQPAQRPGFPAGLRDRAHLAAGREARAAAAGQPGPLYLSDQVGGPERYRAVPADVVSERQRRVGRDEPGQPVRREHAAGRPGGPHGPGGAHRVPPFLLPPLTRCVGVPARRAQPGRSGPPVSHAPPAISASTRASAPASRAAACDGHP